VKLFSKKVFDRASPKNREAEAPQGVVANMPLALQYCCHWCLLVGEVLTIGELIRHRVLEILALLVLF
jgi:hypothetical protein